MKIFGYQIFGSARPAPASQPTTSISEEQFDQQVQELEANASSTSAQASGSTLSTSTLSTLGEARTALNSDRVSQLTPQDSESDQDFEILDTKPTIQTAKEKVEIALKNLLRKDNVEDLWKKKVTGNLISRTFGKIAYLWGKRAALKKDRVAIDFHNRCSELVKAVCKRDLTPDEFLAKMNKRNASNVVLSLNPKDTKAYNKQIRVDKALDAFYATFKARVAQMPEGNGDLATYTKAASKLIVAYGKQTAKFKAESLFGKADADSIEAKIKTTKQDFTEKVFDGLVRDFARKPFTEITPKSFQETVDSLEKSFKEPIALDSETALRDAILKRHDSDEFAQFIEELTNPATVDRKMSAQNSSIKKLETELKALCGDYDVATNSWNGSLDKASKAIAKAKADVEVAQVAAEKAMEAYNNKQPDTTKKTREELKGRPASESVFDRSAEHKYAVEKGDELEAAQARLATAEKEYAKQEARRKEIDGDKDTGTMGELETLKQTSKRELQTQEVSKELSQLSKFYAELQTPVEESQKAVAF